MDYYPVVVKQHPRTTQNRSPESKYWRRFKNPVFIKDTAPVTSIHFSPSRPYQYAVTSGTRIQIFAPKTQKVVKNIARFKDTARSASIRSDGKLVVAGDDSGLVQVFDINSRAILRTLDVHKLPTHVAKFSPLDPTHILTCSDDTTIRVWDMPSQTILHTFTDHTDYVRSGLVSPSNPALILTGSYDSTVRLWDTREGSCVITMRGGGGGAAAWPVEDVLMFPSGSAALSASGPILRVWDLVAGGRCVRAMSNHQKTVTVLAFDGRAGRLLTGGLDQMVKVYDVSTYKVVHTMKYPAPVLSLAISPDDTHIAAGLTDGTLSVRRREPKASEAPSAEAEREALRANTYEFFATGMLGNIGERNLQSKTKSKPVDDVNEIKIEGRRKKRLREYDRLLKSFKYRAALDSVLSKKIPPTVAFSLIQELVHRDGIRMALAGRDDVMLEPVLRLLHNYVSDPRFGELACDLAGIVIDMYSPVIGQSPLIDTLFQRLHTKLKAELKFQKELVRLRGAVEMVMATSTLQRV